ncbi:MAG: hypothetical protein QOG48_1804, partial [Verrucomicrobiota bacterium]
MPCYDFHKKTVKLNKKTETAGMTFAEVLCAALLLAVFFASIFELNAVCLRYIDATKESVAALQGVHDRAEALRNVAFTDLTTTSYLRTLLATAPNASDFCNRATEVVKISAYPTANGVTQLTRAANGTVTTNSTAADLGSTLVQIDVSTSWNTTLGNRPQSEQI